MTDKNALIKAKYGAIAPHESPHAGVLSPRYVPTGRELTQHAIRHHVRLEMPLRDMHGGPFDPIQYRKVAEDLEDLARSLRDVADDRDRGIVGRLRMVMAACAHFNSIWRGGSGCGRGTG